MFPRIYQSFAEFERAELRKLDSLRTTVDDLLEEKLRGDEADYDAYVPRRRRGRPRKNEY